MSDRFAAPSGGRDPQAYADSASRIGQHIAPLSSADLGKLHWLAFNLHWQLADARRTFDVLSDTVSKMPKGLL